MKPNRIKCTICRKEKIHYHLLYGGIEYYFYEVPMERKTDKELRKKGNLQLLLYLFSFVGIILLTKFLDNPGLFIILTLILIFVTAHFSWRNFRGHAIPLELEEILEEKYKIKVTNDLKEGKRNSELELMHRLALGQINPEEYTERMARL